MLALQPKHGKQWANLAREMGTERTGRQVRNRFDYLQERKKKREGRVDGGVDLDEQQMMDEVR